MARVLITGASKGIGREAAVVLARAGHQVVAAMRRPGESDLAGLGLGIELAEVDVDSDASVERLFASGPGEAARLDALVNNAGIYAIEAVEDETIAHYQQVMNTNLFGTIRCAKAVIPSWRARGSGTIVNVTSVAGHIVGPASTAYSASKHAAEAFSEGLAMEMKPFGVRVAVVEPGIIATPMTVENLPTQKPGTVYPHGRWMRAFYGATGASGPGPAVVSEAIRDIVEGRNSEFRTPSGPDAIPFLQLRASQSDAQWIHLCDTLEDEGFFSRFEAISGMDFRPKG
jgi:NAD(P)-dependent dehydrogenase (short-subunit alcohol dehydrogenase family)